MPPSVASGIDPQIPVAPAAMAPVAVSRDRTPTQSLYIPESPHNGDLGDSSVSPTSPVTDSPLFIPSFELDTPDQTFSSDVETSTQTNDSISMQASPANSLPAMPVLPNTEEEKDLKDDGETPRHSSAFLP